MPIEAFDHVNIRTANLDGMTAWYGDILEMEPGWRPAFGMPGAWLYLGGHPLVHLVGMEVQPKVGEPTLEHIALRASDMAGFLDKLRDRGVPWEIAEVPGAPVVQVNIHDPDGNHIHVDFTAAEYAALDQAT